MSTLVNNHHLLPILADWNSAVSFALTWDTEVDPALRGSEARAAFRRWPRPELKFQAATRGAVETNDLRLRLAAALRVDHITPANTDGKTGRVCVPWAGRESWISEYSVSGSTATIELSAIPFAWAVGDYACHWSVCTGETWALHHITAIASLVITTTIVEVSGDACAGRRRHDKPALLRPPERNADRAETRYARLRIHPSAGDWRKLYRGRNRLAAGGRG
jgi:hypothetical protein